MGKSNNSLRDKIPKYELLRNIFLYGIFGVIAAVIDYGIFALLIATGIVTTSVVATTISSLCGFIFTFLTNTFLNFQKTDLLGRRFASYGAICLLGMGISALSMAMFEDFINIYILKAITLVAVSAIQFVLNKLITYRG